MEHRRRIVVIGGGASGMTAAIFAAYKKHDGAPEQKLVQRIHTVSSHHKPLQFFFHNHSSFHIFRMLQTIELM